MTENELKEKIFLQYIGEGTYGIDYEKKHIFEAFEAHHLARLEAITPEMIKSEFPTTHYTDTIYNGGRQDGAKWVIEKLKQ